MSQKNYKLIRDAEGKVTGQIHIKIGLVPKDFVDRNNNDVPPENRCTPEEVAKLDAEEGPCTRSLGRHWFKVDDALDGEAEEAEKARILREIRERQSRRLLIDQTSRAAEAQAQARLELEILKQVDPTLTRDGLVDLAKRGRDFTEGPQAGKRKRISKARAILAKWERDRIDPRKKDELVKMLARAVPVDPSTIYRWQKLKKDRLVFPSSLLIE